VGNGFEKGKLKNMLISPSENEEREIGGGCVVSDTIFEGQSEIISLLSKQCPFIILAKELLREVNALGSFAV
jgi:hypothetical protein